MATVIASFLGFTLLVAVVAWWYTRTESLDSSTSYFLGGRTLTTGMVAGSMLLTNLSTEHLVGLNGAAYTYGLSVTAWETLAAVAIVLLALVFLPRYLRQGLTTIPQFLERRYDATTRTLTTGLFLGMYVVAQLPVVLYSGAVALESLFDVSTVLGVSENSALWLTAWGVGTLGSVYAIFGGLKAVAVSDTVNGIGLLVGGLLVPIFGLAAIGDGSLLHGAVELYQSNPEKFNIIGAPGSAVPFGTLFTGMVAVQVFSWCTNQSFVQRALGAKDLATGQKGVLLAGFFKLLGPIIVVLPGILAYHMFRDSIASPDLAYPTLVKAVLPRSLLGFFAAVVVGAILSTFNSILNSAATLLSIGIYKPYLNRRASEHQLIVFGKWVSVALAVFAMAAAPLVRYAPHGLYFFLQELNSIFMAPILVVVLVGLFTRRVPPMAAKAALIVGSGVYCVVQFGIKPDMHFLHIAGIIFLFNVVLMGVIGRLRPLAVPYVAIDTREVDVSAWKHAKGVGALILALTLWCYICFA